MAALAELANQTHTLTVTQKQLADKERQLAEMQSSLAGSAEGAAGDGARPFLPEASMEVIASLSQELRQPMSAVVGYADLLLGESVGILGALQRKFLERIKASSERMESLLGDLIRVTDIDAGGLQLVPESIDVMVIVEDAILSCAAQFRDKGINLRLDIAENLPTMSADRDALRQIIGHLLANAGAASGNDGDVTLKVRAEMDPAAVDPASHALLIAVRDSGGGVAPEDQPRVFQRFYRADAPLIAGLGETGVGLSVAKALVEAHGGRIWLTSDPGQGSTFTVLLPLHGRNGSAAPRSR
jgi:signal transduction histidine kinase